MWNLWFQPKVQRNGCHLLINQLNSINTCWAWNTVLSAMENTGLGKHQSHCHEVFVVWNTFRLLRWVFWWLCRSLVTLNECQWEVAGMCQKPKCNQNSKCHLLHPKTASNMHYLFSSIWQLFGRTLEMHMKCFWRCFSWACLTKLHSWQIKLELERLDVLARIK